MAARDAAETVGTRRPEATQRDGKAGAPEEDPLDATVNTLIERLEALAKDPDAKLTCDGLIQLIGPRSHALALLIFSLLNLLPAPPGYNFVVGLVITAFAVLLTFNQPIHLWGLVGDRRLPLKALVKLLGLLRRLTSIVTRISSPRLHLLTSRRALPLIGLFGILIGATLLVPIPFTNMLPSIAMAIISLGILNRDGVLVILGFIVGVAGIVVVVLAVWLLVTLLVVVEAAVDDT